MGLSSSKLAAIIGRCLKGLIVALLLPLPIGLLWGMLEQLDGIPIAGQTAAVWVQRGLSHAGGGSAYGTTLRHPQCSSPTA